MVGPEASERGPSGRRLTRRRFHRASTAAVAWRRAPCRPRDFVL